jgi:hypothetical protein
MSNYSTEAMALLRRAREEDEGVYVPPGRRELLALAESLVIAGLLHKPTLGADEYTLTDAGRRLAWADFKPTPVRLSVEEVVYWAVVTESNGITRAIVERDTAELRHTAADIEGWLADHPNEGPWSAMMRRKGRFRLWLVGQALSAIGRERGR